MIRDTKDLVGAVVIIIYVYVVWMVCRGLAILFRRRAGRRKR